MLSTMGFAVVLRGDHRSDRRQVAGGRDPGQTRARGSWILGGPGLQVKSDTPAVDPHEYRG